MRKTTKTNNPHLWSLRIGVSSPSDGMSDGMSSSSNEVGDGLSECVSDVTSHASDISGSDSDTDGLLTPLGTSRPKAMAMNSVTSMLPEPYRTISEIERAGGFVEHLRLAMRSCDVDAIERSFGYQQWNTPDAQPVSLCKRRGPQGRTLMHEAVAVATSRCKRVVEYLAKLEPGALLIADKDGVTPLMTAVQRDTEGHAETPCGMSTLTERLLTRVKSRRKLLTQTDNDGNTALHWAGIYGADPNLAMHLMVDGEVDARGKNLFQESPLDLAVKHTPSLKPPASVDQESEEKNAMYVDLVNFFLDETSSCIGSLNYRSLLSLSGSWQHHRRDIPRECLEELEKRRIEGWFAIVMTAKRFGIEARILLRIKRYL